MLEQLQDRDRAAIADLGQQALLDHIGTRFRDEGVQGGEVERDGHERAVDRTEHPVLVGSPHREL